MPLRPRTIGLAAPLVGGVLLYGAAQLQAQLAADAADPHAAIGHYGVMAALAASIAVAAVIGASSLPGPALAGWVGVAAAMAFGLASILFPAPASSLGVGVGIGLLVVAAVYAIGLLAAAGQSAAVTAEPRVQQA